MRKVAARLGAGTMSLYRYVESRDDLVDLMVDRIYGESVAPERTGHWREDLAEVARKARRVSLVHPWLAGYAASRGGLGPNMLRTIESTLGLVDGYGLHIDQMLDAWMTVHTFTQGYVLHEIAEEQAQRRTGLGVEEWRRRQAPWIRQVIASGRYPLVARVVLDAEDFPDPDQVFERRLAYVLDGLSSLLEPGDSAP
jgi:AcrR family transcriptional regulator